MRYISYGRHLLPVPNTRIILSVMKSNGRTLYTLEDLKWEKLLL
jgi:hypothetical protein